MKILDSRHKAVAGIGVVALMMIVMFQNCGTQKLTFKSTSLGSLGVCGGISCELSPLTDKPSVTTILLALGDEADDQLVVDGSSAQFIAETVIRYSSPVTSPRVLLVRDANSGDEDPEDFLYVRNVLLARFNVVAIDEPVEGLSESDVGGFDLVWLNNPGHPMGSKKTRDTLISFAGGVVLQGDDLSSGKNFELNSLTGLRHVDNGTTVTCAGATYRHDNNGGEQYRVQLDPATMPGANGAIQFRYGNDIDLTVADRSDLEVLAFAQGGPEACTAQRPAIVRYQKLVN